MSSSYDHDKCSPRIQQVWHTSASFGQTRSVGWTSLSTHSYVSCDGASYRIYQNRMLQLPQSCKCFSHRSGKHTIRFLTFYSVVRSASETFRSKSVIRHRAFARCNCCNKQRLERRSSRVNQPTNIRNAMT